MFLTEAAFGLCLVCLVCVLAVQITLSRRGNMREAHTLNLVKLGLSFSACAYLLHLQGGAPGSLYAVLGLLFRLAGTVLLTLAWSGHWVRRRAGLAAEAQAAAQEKDDGPEFGQSLPPHYRALYAGLNSRAREALLCAAQEEALRAGRVRVDTDHLLRGLLQTPQTAASRLLERHGVSAAALKLDEPARGESGNEGSVPGLTPRAGQVLAMAEIEAHRFGKTFVGTEHLLLGLLLVGTGPAASALFRSGLTVDGLRREVILSGKTDVTRPRNGFRG